MALPIYKGINQREKGLEGYFWIATKPLHKISGSIKFDFYSGVNLRLLRNFDDNDLNDPYGTTILGETTFGELITAYQCYRTQASRPVVTPSSGFSVFTANKAFIGTHFPNREDAKLKTLTVGVTNLDSWFFRNQFDVKFKPPGFSIAYKPPETIKCPISPNLQIDVTSAESSVNFGTSETRFEFEYHSQFRVIPSNSEHFSYFGVVISHLCNFLSMASMGPNFPLEVKGVADDGRSIEIWLPLYENPEESNVHYFDMLFRHSQIKGSFPKYLKAWFAKRDELEPIFDLYFGVLYNYRPNVVSNFLSYMQAIETYHIRRIESQTKTKKGDEQRINSILLAVEGKYKEWLKPILHFASRPSLDQRLTDVIKRYPFPVSEMAGDHRAFIKKVKDSRHYYTHYDPAMAEKAKKGGELKGLVMVLGTLLEGLLLNEMGFSLAKAHQLQNNRRRLPRFWY